ncbi:MAG TPA: hypothetical protein VGS28_01745 [Candidatus Saccharimonadales bacterium]|nr:hypothetical protein [Candidatus Saccharimonadales bacterium]
MHVFTKLSVQNKKRHITSAAVLSLVAGYVLFPSAVFAATPPPNPNQQDLSNLQLLIHDTVQFVSAGIGVLLVVFLAVAGLKYLTAGGNSQTVSQAKMQIWNVVVALFLYIFGLIILNFISPGGLG